MRAHQSPRIAEDGLHGRLGLKAQANENVGPIISKGFQQWFQARLGQPLRHKRPC